MNITFLERMKKTLPQFLLDRKGKKRQVPASFLNENWVKKHITEESVPLILHNFGTTTRQLSKLMPLLAPTWPKRPELHNSTNN